MRLARIQSVVLDKALQSKQFFALSCYLNSFGRTAEGQFISPFNNRENMWDIKVCLMDYCANEYESVQLFEFAQKLIGKKSIDILVVNTVEL
jgi:hypothetical protein